MTDQINEIHEKLVTLGDDLIASYRKGRNGSCLNYNSVVDEYISLANTQPIEECVGWMRRLLGRIQFKPSLIPAWDAYDARCQPYVLDPRHGDALDNIAPIVSRIQVKREKEAIAQDFNTTDEKQIDLLWKLTYGGAA